MRWLMIATLFSLFQVNCYAQEYVTVKEFEGSGIKKTSPFTVSSDEWRVVYESESTSGISGGGGHILQITLKSPGDEYFMEMISNQVNKEFISGESYIYESGRFYFDVNAANGDWSIEVQVPE